MSSTKISLSYQRLKWKPRPGTVFTPLRNITLFRQVFVANGTVGWPGGADVAPELLYEQSLPEHTESLVDALTAMPDVGEDDDYCGRRIGIAKGKFQLPDDEPASGDPFDAAWENMLAAGRERCPEGGQEDV